MARLSLTKRLVFSGVVAFGVWLLAEAVVTAFYQPELLAWESPPASPQKGVPVMQGNPYLLYEYPPGSHAERGVMVDINSLGLRGPAVEIPKPDGVVRMYSTGDSSIFGFGVEHAETFTTVAAEQLNAGGAPPTVEPIIGAIPGYSTFQSINLLNLRGLKTDPDLLVIANLWSDNNFDSFVDKDVLAETTAFDSSLKAGTLGLFSKSAVYRLLDWRLRVRDSIGKVQQVGWMQQSRGQIGPRRVGIDDYATNLERLVDMALSRDAGVVFVLPANNEDLAQAESDKAWDPYRQVMRDTAERHGAPVVDVPALFIDSGLPRDALFLDEMHPTATGHRLMGEALAATLAEAGWPQDGLALDGPGGGIPDYTDPFVEGSASSAGTDESGRSLPAPAGGASITGTLEAGDCTEGQILVEALKPGGGNSPVVIGQARVPAGTADFTITLGQVDAVIMRAYCDAEGDGPNAADTLYDFSDTVLEMGAGGRSGVVIDLESGTVTP